MKVISKREFKRMLKENMLVFGTAGTDKATITRGAKIPLFFDEVNQATPETLNTLYEITHKKVSHQKPYRYIPYKHGKHAYKKDKYILEYRQNLIEHVVINIDFAISLTN